MIFDSLQHAGRYLGICPALDKALDLLMNTDFMALSPGRFEVDGDSIFYMVQEPELKPFEETAWENHTRYIDVQMALAPGEAIGWADTGRLEPFQPYDGEKDVAFSDSDEIGLVLPLHQGYFAVFFPGDAHRPNIRDGACEKGRKVVFKVKV